MISLPCTVFLTDPIPCAKYFVTDNNWNIMIYRIEIIGIPPHTTLLYKIEILKSIVYYLNVSLKKN